MASEMRDSTSNRPKMSLEDRAKIFIPFNPLTGFTEALRERERRMRDERHMLDLFSTETGFYLAEALHFLPQ